MIYLELFFTFFKIGLFTFGGGYAMLPLVQSQVLAHGWLQQEEIINFVAVSESTPGPFAVNMSTYVGTTVAGFIGGVCATAGVVLPSFIIILIAARCYAKFKSSKIVSGCMTGLKPAVVGLIAAAVLSVGTTVFFPKGIGTEYFAQPEFYASAGIFAIMTVLAFKKVHPILIICISAAIGVAVGFALKI